MSGCWFFEAEGLPKAQLTKLLDQVLALLRVVLGLIQPPQDIENVPGLVARHAYEVVGLLRSRDARP